jgi:NAD(P)-dependent dehydrogenase (short-subunit alcohol dehydrogenase family)
MMDAEFSGKVAVVTGGSLGMGKASAKLLAERGASVVLCGRRQVRSMRRSKSSGRLA